MRCATTRIAGARELPLASAAAACILFTRLMRCGRCLAALGRADGPVSGPASGAAAAAVAAAWRARDASIASALAFVASGVLKVPSFFSAAIARRSLMTLGVIIVLLLRGLSARKQAKRGVRNLKLDYLDKIADQ